jgi:hypothetical protein
MASYVPSADEIDVYRREEDKRRAAQGQAPLTDEAAYRGAQTKKRNANQTGGIFAGANDFVYGEQVSTAPLDIEAEKYKDMADMLGREYAAGTQFNAPQIGLTERDKAAQNLAAAYAQQNVMSARGLGVSAQDQARQQRALAMAEEAASGKTPSVAEMQGRQQLEQALQGQMALAARARGGNMSLALRSAGQNAAQLQGQAAQNAAILRAQEMQQAREQFLGGSEKAARLGLDAATERQNALGRAAAAYSAETSDQINTGLKVGQANAGFQRWVHGRAGSAVDRQQGKPARHGRNPERRDNACRNVHDQREQQGRRRQGRRVRYERPILPG